MNVTQSYQYDGLNRLTNATELNGTTQNWLQAFKYDRYGNKPFGEKLFGTGGRTAAQGYVGDIISQKFTGYEQDAETGLKRS